MINTPVFKDLVLVGGGHSHALVLQKWAMNPVPGVRVTLISPQTMTPYSGMLPGLLAGHYSFEQTHIDLVKLSLWAKIRFIQDKVCAIDAEAKTLSLENRPDIEFDVLSVDIGSTPNQQLEGVQQYSTGVKPISEFYARWNRIQEQAQQHKIKSLAVVGGGAGSVEVILAMAFKLQTLGVTLQYHLITGADEILAGYNSSVIKHAKQQIQKYDITLHTSTRVEKLSKGVIHCQQGEQIISDEIIWCTQAAGASWVQKSQFDCDDAGFVKVRETLQFLHYDYIFAAGDVANMVANPRPKAGVYAVRQAPILWHNLCAVLLNQKLIPYKPQDGFLSLLALGDKKATGSKSLLSFSGAWVWRWKDSIDRKFMDQFHQLPVLSMNSQSEINPQLIDKQEQTEQHNPLERCAGCGAKVGASVLETVVNDLLGAGSYQPEDAVQISKNQQVTYQSVDALKSPIQDPWVFGKIAVIHALSDLYAMNLKPESAQVLITLPYAGQEIQKRQLKMLMQGVLQQLAIAQCQFLGGHTSEASELSVGLVVNGIEKATSLFQKQGLAPGDKLVLSKPLGTGVILVASMQDQCAGEIFNLAQKSMLQSNEPGANLLSELGVQACTDVTGFGLLGHLYELCHASSCAAKLNLKAIPYLAGVEEIASKGIHSSLYSQNYSALKHINWPDEISQQAKFKLLFDPQTSGGLLAGISADKYSQLNDSFHQQFYTIGEVVQFESMETQIVIST